MDKFYIELTGIKEIDDGLKKMFGVVGDYPFLAWGDNLKGEITNDESLLRRWGYTKLSIDEVVKFFKEKDKPKLKEGDNVMVVWEKLKEEIENNSWFSPKDDYPEILNKSHKIRENGFLGKSSWMLEDTGNYTFPEVCLRLATPEEIAKAKEIVIGGYQAKYSPDFATVHFADKGFSLELIKKLQGCFLRNNLHKLVFKSCSGKEIDVFKEDIERILEGFENK